MERQPQDPQPRAADDERPDPQQDVAEEARREYEEDPSVNPPDERLNDIRGS